MADQRDITLVAGDATPEDVVLNPLPAADEPAGADIILRQVSAPGDDGSSNPADLTLVAGDATPEDVVLGGVSGYPVAGGADIVLRNPSETGRTVPVSVSAVSEGGLVAGGSAGASRGVPASCSGGVVLSGTAAAGSQSASVPVDPLPDAYWPDGFWLAYWSEYWPALPVDEVVHPTGIDFYADDDEEELLLALIHAFLEVNDDAEVLG